MFQKLDVGDGEVGSENLASMHYVCDVLRIGGEKSKVGDVIC